MRMTGDYHLSGDITQEAFVRYLDRYGYQETPSLLYVIARNALYDHIRRRKQDVPIDEIQSGSSLDPNRVLLAREEYRQVLSAMQRLNDDERDVLSLVLNGDFSYREIGDIAGISEANVKVKVHRARQKLRKMLEEDIHE